MNKKFVSVVLSLMLGISFAWTQEQDFDAQNGVQEVAQPAKTAKQPQIAENVQALKAIAASPDVQQELISDPDGVEIQIAEDGSYQVFARGTGVYDFNDPDDIKDAVRDATLKAKAALSKFLKEKVASKEGTEELSKKVKHSNSDGKKEDVSVSKKAIKYARESFVNESNAILTGVITLCQIKQPKGNGGEIQVTVGISSKTLKAAQKTGQGINKSLQDRDATSNDDMGGNEAPAPAPAPNKGYIRRSNSAF